MKSVSFASMLAVAAALVAAPASAQLKLPAPSPAAKVSQEVGLTDISIDYSSPAVKGRAIWGGLVPYDQPWRSGANQATKITFSRDVTFGGKPVPAGTYAIVSFPTAKGWQVGLSKELGLWAGKPYDAKDDVVRVPATTSAIPMRERLSYAFSNTTEDSTSLDLEWEKLRISVPVKADTAAHVQANIRTHVDGAWRSFANTARYLSESKKDNDAALKYAETSIALQSNWFNNWTKAEILARKGQYPEAHKFAQAAWDMGEKEKAGFFFRDQVQKALTEWKSKK